MPRIARRTSLNRRDKLFAGSFQAMGSPCELLTAADDAALALRLVDLAAAEAWRIEDKYSRYLPDNIVDRINRSDGASVSVDDETAKLIDFAVTLHELSAGGFDITSGVLRKAWTFDGGDRVPEQQLLDSILRNVGWHRATWQRPHIALQPGMQIDLGGIGKEYAVDRVAAILQQETSAACLINFGGDLLACGEPHGTSGWQVGIESCDASGSSVSKLIRLRQGALATSGDARRFVLRDGHRYGHILDPASGWPIQESPRSITVAADTCTQAGMLATLAMLQGSRAESFLRDEDVRFWSSR